MSAFKESRNIGDHEGRGVHLTVLLLFREHVTDTKVGDNCSEGIRGDLRLCIAKIQLLVRSHELRSNYSPHSSEQSAFPSIGDSYKSDISDELELYIQPALSALLSLLGESRRSHPRCLEVLVTATSTTPPSH